MRREGDVVLLEGDLTLDHASRLLALCSDEIVQGARVIDLGGVKKVDSSALSLMLCWRRRAAVAGQPLAFRNIPESLHSLAALYGIGELIAG